ncbi:alpha/beta hydrolase family protein [Falsiroseomonas tokyonensis]|uniref:Alpha/beta hydrolase family protein n=1 Tax=Falsiroseomonas tokyonensis TaxID=430521 RepID=A0ABV7BXY9_9PROT|nr:CocE/NonD family hydrolase [Falsiroseomonas tokyonensis]MBU8540291.1 dienelactone hydrolase [Falsiroseomonas tokyonensis]
MRKMMFLLALLASACAAEAPAADPSLLRIAIPGTGQEIPARLCRPDVGGPVPLAVINHGSPANAAGRAGMAPQPCSAEAVRWFLARGFAVLLPLRRGYGAEGGLWAEGYGACASPDFAAGGRQTAQDIAAAVAAGRALPGIRPEGVLVVGQSAGGWGALALASAPPEGVVAVVNMAGGRGGWAGGQPNSVCAADRLVAAAGRFGQKARLPTVWIYTANDSFFGPDLARSMHQAFTAAGGRAQFAALPAFGNDGHSLFFGRGGSAVWGPVVERFLTDQGFRPR